VPKLVNNAGEIKSPETEFTVTFIQECNDDDKMRVLKRMQNIIIKSAIQRAGLSIVGAEKKFLYDFNNLYTIQGADEVRVVPGYRANFNVYQEKILLRVEMSHRLMGTRSVYDQILKMQRSNRSTQPEIDAELAAKSVLTRLLLFQLIISRVFMFIKLTIWHQTDTIISCTGLKALNGIQGLVTNSSTRD